MRQLLLAISTWEWLLLLLLLPLLFLPTPIGALSLLAVPLFWFIRKAATGHFFPQTPYNTAILVLALSVLISVTAVFDVDLSLPKIAGIVMGLALYFAANEHCRQRDNGIWNILAMVILAGTAISMVAIPFARWPEPAQFLNDLNALLPIPTTKLPGAVDGIVNLNELAGILAWIVPLLAAITLGYRRQLWRSGRWTWRIILLVLAVCLAINVFVLLASRSRGGLVSVIIAILVMLAVEFSWGRWLLLVSVVAGMIAVFFFGPDQLLSDPATAVESLGLQARMEIWSRGINALQDFPLTGTSMNGFRRIVHVFYPMTIVPPDTDIAHAHNQLLQAGLDLGLIGLIAYLATWFLSAGLLWQGLNSKDINARSLRPLQVGLAGSFTAAWFFGIVDAIALGARPGFIWWLLLALVAVSSIASSQLRPANITADTAV